MPQGLLPRQRARLAEECAASAWPFARWQQRASVGDRVGYGLYSVDE